MKNKINPSRYYFFLFVLVSALLLSSAQGALIAYEGFDYSSGSLDSQNGGSGWDGAWKEGDWNSDTTGLTYGNLETTGGSAATGADGTGLTHFRDLSATSQGLMDSNDVFWMSFLIQSRSEDGAVTYGVSLYDGGDEETMTGVVGQNASGDTSNVSTTDWTSTVSTQQDTTEDSTTYLFVGKFDMPNDEATFYVNPEIGGSSPINALDDNTASPTSLTAWSTDNIRLGQFNSNTKGTEYSLDEIRFGTDFASVTPIPEPGTLTLLGILLLSCVALNRR